MKNPLLLTVLVSLLLPLGALAQSQIPAPPSAADIARAKTLGANAAGQAQSSAPTYASDGSVIRDTKGDVVTQSNNANALKDSIGAFKQIAGLADIEHVSSPGNKNRTGLANLSMVKTIDFQCSSSPPATPPRYSGGPVVFQVVSCNISTAGAGAVTLRMCDNPAKGSTCSEDADFGPAFDLPANQYTQRNNLKLGLGCNSTLACRITLSGTYSVGGSDQSLKADAQKAANNSLVTQLRTSVDNGSYAGQMQDTGPTLQACATASITGAEVAKNCPGAADVAPAGSAKCTGPRKCVKEATSTQNFSRSCTRTFPLTEKLTHSRYTQSATCTILESLAASTIPPAPTPVWTNTTTCSVPTTSMTKIGSSARLCTKPGATDSACSEYSTVESWIDLKEVSVTGVSASPAEVTGACDTNPLSETRVQSCEGNAWFGRTLPADQCAAQFINEGTGAPNGTTNEMDYTRKAGCGVCLTPVVGQTCYGAPQVKDEADTCGNMDLAGCTLSKATPRNFTGNGGLVSSQEETYACATQATSCVQWTTGEGDNNCLTSSSTFGLDELKQGPSAADGSLNNAMIAAAMLSSTAQGVEGTQAQATPKIFTGTDMRCSRATGGIGQLAGRNCCRTDIERPIGAQLTRAGCTMEDAKLSAARRSSYATYIGDICSSRLWFPRTCLERTETYCVFPGILPRLVQEQGRQQLAKMTATAGSLAKAPLNFSYYDAQGGSWSPAIKTNGVTVQAWQWPSYCAVPESAANKLLSDPSAKECAGVVSTWIAACDNPNGCGALPSQPSEGSSQWQLTALNPLENITTAVSHYAVVSGACSTQTQSCPFVVSAWPAGIGGHAVVTRDLNWSLFANEVITGGTPSSNVYQVNNIGDFMFKGFPTPGANGSALPATVRMDFSRDGGQTWTTIALPTNTPTTEVALAADIALVGQCEVATNACHFRATGTTTVTVKPWGSPEAPDCSGFTPGQLSMLDFGKMDLSEWLSSVMAKVQSQSQTQLAASATDQVNAFNSAFSQGSVKQSKPSSATFARAVPAEGFGPFSVKLVVSGVWPEITGDPAVDKDTVSAVEVDWDDCSVPEALVRVAPGQGSGFSAAHLFKAPDTMTCKGGNVKQNITHKVKITAYTTLSGKQIRSVSVENAWSKFPGGKGNNDNITEVITIQTPANGGPSSNAPPK
ncbi:MAG: conjugal transfer protein TraN [Agitococcus sp.]|nr:conjugal transfer protein TraN [Agitococcus sp.]MDO9176960.1 conjugal transfer protein TraN [Agitococcus sp.]